MKKIFVLAIGLAFAGCLAAQDSTSKTMPVIPAGAGECCAILKDGRTVLTMDGMLVTRDVTFPDGSTLTVNGALIKKDGSIRNLNVGECIDRNTVGNGAKTQR